MVDTLLQDYSRLRGFIDGRGITHVTNLSVEVDGGQIPVEELQTGLAGFTQGSGKVTINFTFTVPVGGFEENVTKFAGEGSYHSFQIGCGPTDLMTTGKFLNCTLSQSVNGSTELTGSFQGKKEWFK